MAEYKDADNTILLETTKGPVVIELLPKLAPQHVERIKTLVREGFYDGIVFHRVIDGFMAQGGCPQGTGTGGSGAGTRTAVPLRNGCAGSATSITWMQLV